MNKNEIVIDGKNYVLKSSIKTVQATKQQIPIKKGKLTFCIIRTYSAGVFAGWINRTVKGMEHTIFNSRRLWYWKTTGLDISTIAEVGVVSDGCKFSEIRAEIDLKQVIEVQPCSKESKVSIERVEVYKNAD